MSDSFTIEAPYRGLYRLEEISFGPAGGPSAVIVAGLHGNELNGIHAANLVARTLNMSRLRGRVSLFPVVNTFGLEHGTKRWPFGDRDINQAFPGDPAGSPVQRIAHALLERSQADVCVDIHSGSPLLRELPQVRVPLTGPSVELARATQLPLLWRRAGDVIESTGLVGAWRRAGRTALHMVAGRGATLNLPAARQVAEGILRLLHHMGILPIPPSEGQTLAEATLNRVHYHYSDCGGFWVPEVRVGDRVAPGHLLGTLQEVIGGRRLAEVRAEHTGVVITMRCYPMVHARELMVRVVSDS